MPAVPIPPTDMRQIEILRAELAETRRQKAEMKELLVAALEENKRYKDASKAPNGERADGTVRQLEAECQNMQLANKVGRIG